MRIHPHLPLIVMMLVVFATSFAIMSRNRGTQESSGLERPAAQVRQVIALAPIPARAPPLVERGADTIAPLKANAVPLSTPTPAAPAAPMPVVFQINHNHRQNVTEAILGSLSDTPLSIQVNIVNPGTRMSSQLQLELDPHGSKTFGAREGVELNSGDQVTLQSPPFQEQSQQVP
jgi:hypothetical protein